MTQSPRTSNPPPLTVAVSVAVVQALVLLSLAVLELANVASERVELGVSTAFFFGAYGAVLLAAGAALWRRHGWARGPVLITQLIFLGLAWSLRDHVAVAVVLAICAGIVLAGMLHPDTLEALDGDPEGGSDGRGPADQASDSSD